ncbi:MAG: PhnA protein [Cetobacterium sp.]|uniref:PhnA protein n=1 Tax=Cetobacterium sp. TaxID=2071632 RepID=UPI0025E68B60|nr:PhnA protein [uncultured Cetobacterium sp.]
MAKGFDKHQERLNIVSGFGKNLARRSKSKCELCEATGVKLSVFEVPPSKDEPDYDRCIFLCENCIELLKKIKKSKENDFRFLSGAMWSETPIVKVTAIYILNSIKEKYSWAEELLENAYLDEEENALLETINF